MIKRLFLDIETSPNICYTWRTGNKVFLDHNSIIKERAIICVCYKWEHQKRVNSIEWNDGDDSELIDNIHSIMSEADEVVGHNGDRFDIPWINTRAVKKGLPPMPGFKQVDTLKMARRTFYFNSNKLDYLAQFLFNDEKLDTGGFSLWKNVLNGDKSALDKMVRYCKKDVLLLERVYNKLIGYSSLASHQGVQEGSGRWSCPQCGSSKVHKNKTSFTKAGMRRHEMKCKSCFRYYRITDNVFGDYLERYDNMSNQRNGE